MALHLIGRLLRGRHAGDHKLAWHHPSLSTASESITLGSSAFAGGGTMPRRHAGPGVGENLSPELHWSGEPEGTVEWVIIVEDPDAPLPNPFVHLIAWGIPSATQALAEGDLNTKAGKGLRFGHNTFRGHGYSGPRALPSHGPHRYVFQIYALSRRLSFSKMPDLKMMLTAMEGAVMARGRLDGFFEQV